MYVYDYDKFFMNILPLIYLNDKCCLCLQCFFVKNEFQTFIYFLVYISWQTGQQTCNNAKPMSQPQNLRGPGITLKFFCNDRTNFKTTRISFVNCSSFIFQNNYLQVIGTILLYSIGTKILMPFSKRILLLKIRETSGDMGIFANSFFCDLDKYDKYFKRK